MNLRSHLHRARWIAGVAALVLVRLHLLHPVSLVAQPPVTPALIVTGNLDLRVTGSTNRLELGLHDIISDRTLVAETLVLSSDGVVVDTVPDAVEFAFLGVPGAPVWVWPQLLSIPPGSASGHLFLGTRAVGLAQGVFVEDQVGIEFIGVDGPGRVAAYFDTAGRPAPPVWIGDGQAVVTNQTLQLVDGLHVHMNWAFTKPGRYQLELRAAATNRLDLSRVVSAPLRLTLQVPEWRADRTRQVEGGTSIVVFNFNSTTGKWEPRIEVSATARVDGFPLFTATQFEPSRLLLRYRLPAVPRPSGSAPASYSRWETVGVEAGVPFLHLPGATGGSNGLGALQIGSTVQPGVFIKNPFALGSAGNNNWVTAELQSTQGPGAVSAWIPTGPSAAPVPFFAYSSLFPSNTLEFSIARVPNVFPVPTPGFWDLNWGFSKAGNYELGFVGSGTLEPGLAGFWGGPETRSSPFTVRLEILQASAPAQLLRPRVAAREGAWVFLFDLQGEADTVHQIQRSLDLVRWEEVARVGITSTGIAEVSLGPLGSASAAFYRTMPVD